MSLNDVGKNALSSVTGAVEKAKLYIHKTADVKGLDPAKLTSATMGALIGAVSMIDSSVKKLDIDTYEMTVQYNPSTLTIQANAESIPFTYLQQNMDNGIPNQSLRPPMVVLSVQLIFDDMNTQDAFMMDRLRLTAGSLVSDAASVAKMAKGGYTVQPQTNGLLATVMRANTKIVTFCWADMSFTGQVVEVQAKYTMFSPSGRPIRSMVTMNIAQQVEAGSDIKYWDNVLDQTFKNSSALAGKGADQKLGNILNLNAF